MMRGSWRDRDADTRLLNSSLPLTSGEHLAVQIAKHVPFFSVPSVYMTPAQLCLHSQLPKASLAPGLPISPCSLCQPRRLPQPQVLPLCHCLAISQALWEEPQERKARDNARIQLPTQSNPFLVTATREPLGCHPWVAS